MNLKKIALVVAAAAAIGLFFYFDLQRYLTVAELKAHRAQLLDYYATHRLQTVLVFVAIYVVQTALSLPGAAILSLSAGAIFGAALGTLYAVLAATVGATLAFLASRYLFRDAIVGRFGAKLEGINRELAARGGNYLLFLRLVPLFPFFLINLAAGLTPLPLRTFVLTTFVGIIPGGFVFCNAGASLASVQNVREVASGRVLLSFALLGLFALVPAIYAKIKSR
ncbi:TVP38/TMEM64 family protein [Geomesophilobacter sediminis]|uniref:TVP38/TMEM64 family protein n=1 Tax=Geomesophilobacter sediminis TaxID=2798584 RepID=A0A8J7S7Z2_9BACT|nr:TVP38/TMEM64 family protein [Geomesophilobacter sediminis]MBJ6727252.1 TVP38/TMEM64 family protein [Geomesophilobacter sediminis]